MQDILQNYQRLLASKDRELMHHVLFSFKNFHDKITKIDLWMKLPESIKLIYS